MRTGIYWYILISSSMHLINNKIYLINLEQTHKTKRSYNVSKKQDH